MEYQRKEISLYLKGIGLLLTRQRRSILPIVGKVLSTLFGTVTEGDVQVIKPKVIEVEKNQNVKA